MKQCDYCQNVFFSKRPNQKFCKNLCRLQSHKKYVSASARLNIDVGLVGAMNELRVAADLTARGFYVFRAVGAHAPFDLAAYEKQSGTLIRVEVAGGMILNSGISYSRHQQTSDHFDALAVALPDSIIYLPELQTLTPGTLPDLGPKSDV